MTIRREGPGVAKVAAMLNSLDGLEAKVGWFENATYPDGTMVAYIATIHEFGYAAGGIPARPFMRPAVVTYGPSWMDLLAQGAKAAVMGNADPRNVLEMVAMRAAGDVAKMITALPPLTNLRTIGRKGHAKALVHTGQLIQSVTHRVEVAA